MENDQFTRRVTYTVDEALKLLGGFWFFQWIMIVSLGLTEFPLDANNYIMVFHSYKPPWRCISNSSLCVLNGTLKNTDDRRCDLPRSEWEYTTTKDISISTEFDLICGREWMQTLLSSIVYVGWGIGAVVLGYLADNYGRKSVCYPSLLMIMALGTIISFMRSLPVIILCRLLIGFFFPGALVQSFVLATEYADTKRRPFATLLVFVLGIPNKLITLLKAYYIRQWRILQLVCTAPYVITLFSFFFVPESLRYMRLKGKEEQVQKTLKRIAFWNRREFPSDMEIEPINEDVTARTYSVIDIFRTCTMALRSSILGYTWLVNGMVFYAFYFAAGNLGGSIYINFLLIVVSGLPSAVINAYLCRQIGRKKTTIIAMVAASICCLSIAFIPDKDRVIRVAFAFAGSLFISVSFSAIYTWSVEIYPTTIRANGMGFLQVTSRVGASSAPWVATTLVRVHKSAPYVVMSVTTFIGALLSLWLPETARRQMLEVDEDVANEGELQLLDEVRE